MQQIPLDRHDISILSLLQENSQIPRLELAEKVGLSASQCFRRIKRLEDTQLIKGYAALVDKDKAGIEVSVAVLVQYRKSELQAREKLIELIQRIDEIQECYAITGEHDFWIKVHCKTMKEFSYLINHTFQVSYISGLHSYILMDCIKNKQGLALTTNQ
ncbi:Lrp/AsnC family transcriptional regulator [Marinomonas agarivorans]|nr:Lrp/AsnC family transcriptional regulator [Marinomonas agarivorans]